MRHTEWTSGMVRRLLKQDRLSRGHLDKPGWGVQLEHPVIITPTDHREVLRALESFKKGRKKEARIYPLSGHLLCPGCGAGWVGFPQKNGRPVYRCGKRYPRGAGACDFQLDFDRSSVDAVSLEDEVWSRLFGHRGWNMGDIRSLKESVLAGMQITEVSDERVEAARQEVKKLEDGLARAEAERLIEGKSSLTKASRLIAERLEKAEDELERLSLLRAETAEQRAVWDQIEEASLKVAGLVGLEDPGQRKKVMDTLGLVVSWEVARSGFHEIVIRGTFRPARLVGMLANPAWPKLVLPDGHSTG